MHNCGTGLRCQLQVSEKPFRQGAQIVGVSVSGAGLLGAGPDTRDRLCEKITTRSSSELDMSTVPPAQVHALGPPKKRRWKPLLLRTAFVLFIFWLGFVAFMWRTMKLPPEKFGAVMSHMPIPAVFLAAPFETMWVRARAGQLHPGDVAPEFNLQTLDKTSRVVLSSLNAHGPVVLVFGSYT